MPYKVYHVLPVLPDTAGWAGDSQVRRFRVGQGGGRKPGRAVSEVCRRRRDMEHRIRLDRQDV